RTNVALFIHRAVRPLAPPGVGTRGPVALGLQRVNGRPGPRSAPPAKTRKRVEEKGCDLMTRLPKAGERGFTIVELMIVVTIAGILIMLAEPSFTGATTKAREAALKQNLFTMRDVIDQFKADRGKYPAALLELKEVGYLKRIAAAKKEAELQELRHQVAELRQARAEQQQAFDAKQTELMTARAERDQLVQAKAEFQAQLAELPQLRQTAVEAKAAETSVQARMKELESSMATLT